MLVGKFSRFRCYADIKKKRRRKKEEGTRMDLKDSFGMLKVLGCYSGRLL